MLLAGALAATALTVAAGSAWAAPEDRDSTFSGDGIVFSQDVGSRFITGEDIAVDHQGRIVVAVSENVDPGGVQRLLPDGTPDADFGTNGNGVVTYNGVSRVTRVAVDSQDRVLFAGYKSATDTTIAANVVRLTEDGDLDGSFHADGTRGLGNFIPAALRVRPADGVLLGLVPWNVDNKTGSSARSEIHWLTASGARDGGFGTGVPQSGAASVDFGFPSAARSRIDDLMLGPGGTVVALGSFDDPGTTDAVIRVSSAGAMDPAFGGGDGRTSIPAGNWRAIAADAGRTVVAGYSTTVEDEALVRLTASGSFDTSGSFGGDGMVAGDTAPSFSTERPTDVLVDGAGRILMAGRAVSADQQSGCFFLARFTSSGALDGSFSPTGDPGSTVDCGGFLHAGKGLAMDASGRPLMSGEGSHAASAPDATTVVRYKPFGAAPPPPPPPPPDGDGDGVPDSTDQCPTVAGPASNNGCPVSIPPATDTDGDGIPNSTDACPTQRGVASTDPAQNGCPQGGVNPANCGVVRTLIPRTLRKVARRGVAALVSCDTRARITVSVRVPARVAQALGTDTTLLGFGQVVVPAGQRRWLVVRPFPALRRALRAFRGSVRLHTDVDVDSL